VAHGHSIQERDTQWDSYNALIAQVRIGDPKKVKEVQMQLLRQGDERANDRYGKSAPPLRQRARQHTST